MTTLDIFPDTCIFFSYAYIFEDYSDYSEKILTSSRCTIYTSATVKTEIAIRRDRRDQAYPEFLKALINGVNLEEMPRALGIYLSNNDLGHLKSLRDNLFLKKPNSRMLADFRRWKKISDERFDKAEACISGTIPECKTPYMKDIIKTIINNDSDSKIVLEVFEWSKSIADLIFVTTDITDLYMNKVEILEKLIDYYNLDKDPFRISHVVEFAFPESESA